MKRLVALALVFGSALAMAEGGRLSVSGNAKWKEECGSCHIAYPPQLLTGENWKRLMGGLDRHFGANAALDEKSRGEILDFLVRNSGNRERHSAPSLRISDTSWFRREHREVSNQAWSHPKIKTRSNCAACHVNAERGDWSEGGVRMPAGLRAEDD